MRNTMHGNRHECVNIIVVLVIIVVGGGGG